MSIPWVFKSLPPPGSLFVSCGAVPSSQKSPSFSLLVAIAVAVFLELYGGGKGFVAFDFVLCIFCGGCNNDGDDDGVDEIHGGTSKRSA